MSGVTKGTNLIKKSSRTPSLPELRRTSREREPEGTQRKRLLIRLLTHGGVRKSAVAQTLRNSIMYIRDQGSKENKGQMELVRLVRVELLVKFTEGRFGTLHN